MQQHDAASARAPSPADEPAQTRTRPDGTQLGPLDDFIGFHLRLAQDASFRAFARMSGVPDLKPGRFAAMMVIRANPGITHVALSRAIARDKSTMTPLVRDLETRGFVKRTRSQTDRRNVTLTLTKAGERMVETLSAHAREHDRKLDTIVGERKDEFITLLRRIADVLG